MLPPKTASTEASGSRSPFVAYEAFVDVAIKLSAAGLELSEDLKKDLTSIHSDLTETSGTGAMHHSGGSPEYRSFLDGNDLRCLGKVTALCTQLGLLQEVSE